MTVLGVDACKTGWIGIVLEPSTTRTIWAADIVELVAQCLDAACVAIDIPIGLFEDAPRTCDTEARRMLGTLGSTVFATPVRRALEASSYEAANQTARDLTGSGISRQAYGLRTKILQVDQWLRETDMDVREVHPEVCFATMAGRPLATRKKTWAGFHERRGLLERAMIVMPNDIGDAGGRCATDDVLDAAACAWTARRVVEGSATCIPEPPERAPDGRAVAIWV
jgi:predicted RNase H-like nuclease